MRVYTVRLPKWISQITRACLNMVSSTKQKSKKTKVKN